MESPGVSLPPIVGTRTSVGLKNPLGKFALYYLFQLTLQHVDFEHLLIEGRNNCVLRLQAVSDRDPSPSLTDLLEVCVARALKGRGPQSPDIKERQSDCDQWRTTPCSAL